MKKIASLFLIVICVAFQQYAQSPLSKGVYTLSGSVDGKYSKAEYGENSAESYMININPSYGYFITDNILVSGNLSYSYYEDRYTTPRGTSSYIMRSINFGPSARYYFNYKGIVPFAGIHVTYSKYLGEDSYAFKYGAEAGIDYFIAKTVAIEPFVGYEIFNWYKPDETVKNVTLGIRVSHYIL